MRETENDGQSSYSLRTLHRGMEVLKAFTFEQPEWSLADLTRALGWNRANLHRLLLTLREAGMLSMDPATSRYRLGIAVFEMGGVVLSGLGLTANAYPHMAWLTETTGLACNLGIMDGDDVVYIDKIEAGTHLQLSVRPGTRLPAYRTALGRAILSRLPDDEAQRILAAADKVAPTPHTITSVEGITARLDEARRRGFSLDMQENSIGIAGLGAAIVDHRGRAFAGISMGGHVAHFSPERIEELGAAIRTAALQISRACGASIFDMP